MLRNSVMGLLLLSLLLTVPASVAGPEVAQQGTATPTEAPPATDATPADATPADATATDTTGTDEAAATGEATPLTAEEAADLEAGDIADLAEPESQVSGDIPPEIASHDDDWTMANKDYRNTRAVLQSNISTATVDQLEVAWSFPIPGRANFGAAASAPVIIAGTVYFQDLASNVFALDLLTGEVVWSRMYDNPVIGPNGPAVGYGKVFVISGVDEFAALNIETGEEVWSRASEGRPTGAFQPYVYGGHVYFTTQAGVGGEGDNSYRGYAGGTSGHILALDPETGETVWDFQTVEAGFWGNPELNSGGGVWFSPAIDTLTGVIYWGTGNPAPFPGTFDFPNASSRPEPNLYANSLLAMEYDTGELVWFNYVNPNDLFDLDFQISPILATVQIEAEPRDIVIGSGKLGHIIAFDRATGAIIWNTAVGIHQNDDLTEIPPEETVVVYPGILGGVETPMAYADGVVYAPVLNLPTTHSATGYGAADGTEALNQADANTPTGSGTSEVVALDAANGQILWSHEFASDMYGGVTVVNDLLFVATFDGHIYALDRGSGLTVWSYQAPGGINAWPAVADDTIVWAAGFGEQPSLLALRLPVDALSTDLTETDEAGATDEMSATDEASATEESAATEETGGEGAEGDGEASGDVPDPSSVGDLEAGEQLFVQGAENEPTCASCHSVEPGASDGTGPALGNIATEAGSRVEGMNAVDYLHESIVNPDTHLAPGFTEGIMPDNFDEIYSEDQINNLVAYLLTLTGEQ